MNANHNHKKTPSLQFQTKMKEAKKKKNSPISQQATCYPNEIKKQAPTTLINQSIDLILIFLAHSMLLLIENPSTLQKLLHIRLPLRIVSLNLIQLPRLALLSGA